MADKIEDFEGAATNVVAPLAIPQRDDPPFYQKELRPHRSLSRKGFVVVIAITAIMFCFPLMPLLGSPALWIMLPFMAGATWLLWHFIERSFKDREISEQVKIWPDLITVTHQNPREPVQCWHANPYWCRIALREDARIESYLTLKGNGREIELGAFLSPEERVELHQEIQSALHKASPLP